ncbi:MAG: hypothetical protein ABW202_07795 [Duganella sp.]
MKSLYLRSGLGLLCAAILGGCGGSDGNLQVAGSIFGLTKPDLVLINRGNGETLAIPAGATSFVFTRLVAENDRFDVAVQTPPRGATCELSQNSGSANVYSAYQVQVVCTNIPRRLGGTVSGLSSGRVVLTNGADTVEVQASSTAGATIPFTFAASVGDGAPYGVTVLTQPATLTCTVTNGAGTMGSADLTNVAVTCSARTS